MYADMSIDIDGCDANGNHVSTWCDSQWDAHYEQCNNSTVEVYSPPSYAYEFNSKEELMASKVFQEALAQSLAHKQKTIDALQKELLRLSRTYCPVRDITHEDVRFYEQRQRDNAWG